MNQAYTFWLASCSFLTNKQKKDFSAFFSGTENGFGGTHREYVSLFGEEKAILFEKERKSSGSESRMKEAYLSYLEAGYSFVSVEQDVFPEKLCRFGSDPFGLFYRGTLYTGFSVAMVGARAASHYGLHMAKKLGSLFAECEVPVISGLARGIDSEAQKAVLQNGGISFAFLGSGIDICYPAEHKNLYHQIAMQGAVISEYPPGTKAMPYFFPQRNRLIAAMSDLVIVLEAGRKSGSLITAEYALQYGKDVYCLPGRLDNPKSLGCNDLIHQGATIICSEEMLMEDLGLAKRTSFSQGENQTLVKKGLAQEDDLLYSCFDLHPKSLDFLQNKLNCDANHLLQRLTALELSGLIEQVSPGMYCRT